MPSKSLTIEQVLTLLAETPVRLAALSAGLAPDQLHTSPGPGEWSANDVLAHLRSCADVWGGCIAAIIAEDAATPRAVDPRTWTKQTDYPDQEFGPSLAAFTAQRAGLLAILEPLPPASWARAATVTGAGRPLPEAVRPQSIGGDTTMRVMVLVKATSDSEAGIMPSTELLEAMGTYNEALVNAGIMLAGEGLQPSATGKRVLFDGPQRIVTDGPFIETKELVAGYWLWEVKDMAEAVAWVKRCPNPMPGPSEIEIRPVYEMADFGEAMTPEVAALHDRVRDKAASR